MPAPVALLILCPTTGKPLPTGVAVNPENYDTQIFMENVVGNCPHCGQDHVWSKEDAFLEGSPPPAS